MNSVSNILSEKKLRQTPVRTEILKLFVRNDYALSYQDIQDSLPQKQDKVTVYRTLSTFQKKGIIHQVPISDQVIKYAICKHECSSEKHHDKHIHLLCKECNKTICLDEISGDVDGLKNNSFQIDEIEILLKGTCETCVSDK